MTLGDDFTAFWAVYPLKVGKLDALKAYEKARKLDSAEHILAGLEVYKQHLPSEKRFICHPATWLNRGRWMDEDFGPERPQTLEYWADVCQREHGMTCRNRWDHEMKLREQAS